MPTHKKNTKRSKPPPILIAHQIARAAETVGLSVLYLQRAIDAGRLNVVTKRPKGRQRALTLILAEDLQRFAEADELDEQTRERAGERLQAADETNATWDCVRSRIVLEATLIDGRRIAFDLTNPELLSRSLRVALSRRSRDQRL